MLCPQGLREFLLLLLFLILCSVEIAGLGEVIWAVNSGGDSHVDVHGIRYQKDSLRVGTPSDYGRSLHIHRVLPQDQILYQTERYHSENFAYEVPIGKDGNYVLVLKFSEVWFTQPNQKVFDVQLNGQHLVVEGLDIYNRVGRGVAHDEIIPFSIKNGMLKVAGESSVFDGKLSIEFVKLDKDNPKINALYLMRGKIEDVPDLPSLPGHDKDTVEEEEEEEIEEDAKSKSSKVKRPPAEKKVQNPYASDDTSSMMLPVVIAVGAFIPLLFCLCKL